MILGGSEGGVVSDCPEPPEATQHSVTRVRRSTILRLTSFFIVFVVKITNKNDIGAFGDGHWCIWGHTVVLVMYVTRGNKNIMSVRNTCS